MVAQTTAESSQIECGEVETRLVSFTDKNENENRWGETKRV